MDQREHPRTRREAVAGLDVIVVPVEGRAVHGHLVDMSATGAGVGIAAAEGPRLTQGERVVLVIGAHQLDPPVTASAVTLHQEEQGEELHVGLRFVDPEALMASLSGTFRTLFNARQAPRVRAEPDAPITVAVRLPVEGGGVAEPMDAEIDDISATGLSLELPVEAAESVAEGAILHLVVRLPGQEVELPLSGIVRDRIPLGDRWRLGVEFDPAATPDFEAQQAGIVAYVERRRAPEEPA